MLSLFVNQTWGVQKLCDSIRTRKDCRVIDPPNLYRSSYMCGPNMIQNKCFIGLSDNMRSDAFMAIHGWRGECAHTVNDAGIYVLEPCLTHAWVFQMAFQCGTCQDIRILQSSFDWQTMALLIDERHDCCAINNTFPGGPVSATC